MALVMTFLSQSLMGLVVVLLVKMTVEEGLKMVVSGGIVTPPDPDALDPDALRPEGHAAEDKDLPEGRPAPAEATSEAEPAGGATVERAVSRSAET